ncbi:MAG: S-layer homology domain-containing protein, partial [Oscillospiraceae bacterium]
PNKIETNRIRIYIKDAKRSYDNFRVDELVVFGFDSEKASNNIAKKANIVVEYPCTEENVNGLLNDENYDTIVSSSTEIVPSKYKPAIISLDFGKDSYYKMSDLEFITKEVNKFGVSELDIEYRELGQWKTFKTIQFTHNGMHSSENYAIDKINMEDISTNGIRIKITSALLTDQHFNINEIICHGVIDENAKIANNINGEIIANDGYENLFDENDETIWKSSFTEVPTLQNPEMITFKFKREFTPKVIEFKCPQPDKKITSVQIGYYEGTTLHEIKGETTLLWENDVATVVIDADQTMNNLVVCITGANGTGYSVSGINVLAFDQYSRVVKSISEFEKTKKYSAYEIALNLVNAINDDIIKQEFLNKLTIILEKVKNEQFINASYDVFKKELSINGKLFEKSQYNANISILNGTTYEKIVQTKIDENGLFSTKVPMDDVTVFGEYIIKTVVQGKPISTNVVVREPSSQNDFITFSIDGCNGSISGNNIYVELPHGSSLTKRTPLFKVSEYAKVYYGENEMENGKTKIDFTTSTEIKVIAENHDVKIYNIKVTIANGNNGGGGGSGGGSSNSNGNRNENGNVIFPPSIENTNKTFTDVSNEHWAYSYIMELKNDGIVSGVNDTEFKPDDSVKREELAKMLVIMKELPISENNSVFKDVIGNWSMKYVQTIFESGIAKGFSDDIFGVGEDITREDLAVMLYRSLNDEQRNVKITEVERFIDDSEISEYAKTAVYTLRCLGIISGYENVFNPQGTATRAETAKILCGVRR